MPFTMHSLRLKDYQYSNNVSIFYSFNFCRLKSQSKLNKLGHQQRHLSFAHGSRYLPRYPLNFSSWSICNLPRAIISSFLTNAGNDVPFSLILGEDWWCSPHDSNSFRLIGYRLVIPDSLLWNGDHVNLNNSFRRLYISPAHLLKQTK